MQFAEETPTIYSYAKRTKLIFLNKDNVPVFDRV